MVEKTLHRQLLDYLRHQDKNIKKFPELHNPEISDDRLMHIYFLNFRGNIDELPKGLRLTHAGHNVMKNYFECFEIKLDPSNFTMLCSKHILFLEKNCKMPWAYDMYSLYIYERDFALRLKLAGDLDILINSQTF